MSAPTQIDQTTAYLATATVLCDPATGLEIIVCGSSEEALGKTLARHWPDYDFAPEKFRRVVLADAKQLEPLDSSKLIKPTP